MSNTSTPKSRNICPLARHSAKSFVSVGQLLRAVRGGNLLQYSDKVPDVDLSDDREKAEFVEYFIRRTCGGIDHGGRVPSVPHQHLHAGEILAHSTPAECHIDGVNTVDMDHGKGAGTLGFDTDTTVVSKLKDGAQSCQRCLIPKVSRPYLYIV